MERVGLTSAASEGNGGTYHLLTPEETESLCGILNDSSWWGTEITEIVSRADTEQRGYTPCEHCQTACGTTATESSAHETP